MFISDLKASVAEAKEAPEGKGTMVALYGTCSRFVICGVAPRRWTLYVPTSPLFVPTADSIPVSRFVQVLEARAPSDRPSWKKWRVSFWIRCTRRDAGDGGGGGDIPDRIFLRGLVFRLCVCTVDSVPVVD